MTGDGDIRIGTRERDDALAALAVHHEAGRLDAFDYEDRRGRARDAVTRSDVTALFVDLPEPRPRFEATLSALAPFIGLAAFALTRSWLALLLIPAIAIIAKNLED
jgi:hypothetical protein